MCFLEEFLEMAKLASEDGLLMGVANIRPADQMCCKSTGLEEQLVILHFSNVAVLV